MLIKRTGVIFGIFLRHRSARPATFYFSCLPAVLYYPAADRVDIINLLASRGANLNASGSAAMDGWRALHAAVSGGRCDAIGALLALGADPNRADNVGVTPLMLACRMPDAGYRLRMAEQLLRGGSKPALQCKQGAIALTHAAAMGDADVIKLLVAAAPATLNHPQLVMGVFFTTPLGFATTYGGEAAVRALLSLGASDREVFERQEASSLTYAADRRMDGMVKLLLDEGLEAVGGLRAVAGVACEAVQAGDARILHLLISVEGEAGRRRWARKAVGGVPLLHAAAAFNALAVVVLLLAAGADESLADARGLRPRDMIGAQVPPGDNTPDETTEAAIGRALRRGPAFRARSWAWPTLEASGGGGLDSAAGAVAAVPGGVRVFRPRGRFFVSRLTR